ncbi:Protein disulfide isomerase [Entamoeba marina]
MLLFFLSFAISTVVPITPSTFTEETQNPIIIKFYTPWCSHCISLEPVFNELSNEDHPYRFGSINCQTYEPFCVSQGIKGFPVIRIYSSGVLERVQEGPRDIENLRRFLRGEEPIEISNILKLNTSSFDDVVNDVNTNVVVKFFKPDCNACRAMHEKYEKLPIIYENEDDILFVQVDCSNSFNYPICRERFGINKYPTITFFPKNYKYGKDFVDEHELIAYVNVINRVLHYDRTVDGTLSSTAGRLKRFDKLCSKFTTLSDEQKQTKIDLFNTFLSLENSPNAKTAQMYYDVLVFLRDNNKENVETEIAHLKEKIKGCEIKEVEYLQKRINVLRACN